MSTQISEMSCSAIAKQNRANAVPHTSGSKSHACVTEEMAVKLGQKPRRDQVYIETHTCKKGDKKGSYVPQAAATIKDFIDKAEEHPDWKEKSIEAEEDNDGEEDDDERDYEEPFVHRRVVAKPPAKSSSTHEDESLIGMDVLLYAWTGPETPVAKATIISIDQNTIVGREPLGPATYEVVVNVVIKRDATLPYEYDGLRFVADAVTRSIAWPSSKMKPYKPGASSSSRR